ncbi:hypothetical protein ACJIZ3_021677 [Penstemon smallii]|uniref:RRM domain-containing protein n=1 Tax=Penstemon smallii TaxID=265156 RepID=A0ABD3SMU2_9LAMI
MPPKSSTTGLPPRRTSRKNAWKVAIDPNSTSTVANPPSSAVVLTETLGSNTVDSYGDAITSFVAPQKAIIQVEDQIVMGSENETNNNDVILSSLPPVENETLIERVVVSESGVAGPPEKGKRKIVKKTMKIVKRVIRRRVAKRVLTNGTIENEALLEKEENGLQLSDVKDSDHVIEKCNIVNEITERTNLLNEETSDIAVDDVTECFNPVNEVTEKSNLVDDATEKTASVNEVMEKLSSMDEVKETLEFENVTCVSEPVVGEEGKDLNGIDSMEMETSRISCGTGVLEPITSEKDNNLSGIGATEMETAPINIFSQLPEQNVGEKDYDKSGILSMNMANMKNNDVMAEANRKGLDICVHDSIEVEKVHYEFGSTAESGRIKKVEDSAMDNASKNSVVENQDMNIVNKESVGPVAGRNEGSLEAKNVVLVGEKDGSPIVKVKSGNGEVECHSVGLNEGVFLSGELEAMERRKRRKTEIFVGGLDKDTKEDDIRKVFEEVGAILEVRLVMNSNTGKNKGFAFVRFATAADAKNALTKYSKVEICGKQCGATPVEGNDTLFLGNINKQWKIEDVAQFLEKAGIEKVDKITLKADPNNFERNRGFAFVELETSKDAQSAFHKLQKKTIFGKDTKIKVAWAQPLIEPAEEELLKVKTVYAEYLPASWDEARVKEYFKRFGEIENVVLAKDLPSSKRDDFAFVKYTTRDAALACIEAISRERLEDVGSKVKITVSLAKPISMSKQMKHASYPANKQLSKKKPIVSQATIKLHEPRSYGKPARTSYDRSKVDTRSSTTNELVQILRQQASSNYIQSRPSTGTNMPGHHFPSRESKRPFSLVAHDPLYLEPRANPRARIESSYPISGPSSLYHDVRSTSFPYQQQGPDPRSVNGRNIYPSQFQTRGQPPYYGDSSMYRRH